MEIAILTVTLLIVTLTCVAMWVYLHQKIKILGKEISILDGHIKSKAELYNVYLLKNTLTHKIDLVYEYLDVEEIRESPKLQKKTNTSPNPDK